MRLPTALLLAVVGAAAVARADADLPVRTLRIGFTGDRVVASGAFPELLDGDLLEQLASGFAQTVLVRVYVVPEGEREPVWFTAATYRALYAQWDEVFLVRLRDPAGERNLSEATRADALADLTTLRELPVCPLAALTPGRRYFLGVVVEVNPVTPALVAEVRKWLTRPRGGQVGTESLFGSFVSIFANPRVPEADRTLRFRSQSFSTGPPP